MKLKLQLCCLGLAAACTAFVFAQQPGGGTRPADPTRPADTGKGDTKATTSGLDGTWTVVSIEKNGEAMKDASAMTVTVKDNTATFSGKDGKQAMSVRFEFTGPGMARVTMDEGSGTGTGRDDKGGTGGTTTTPGTGGGRDDKGTGGGTGSGAKAGTGKSAVYVLTNEYLAVCVHDDKTSGSGTGGTGTGGTGGTTTTPGTGTGRDDKGTGGTGSGTTSNYQPTAKNAFSVILKRGGTGGTGR